MRHTSALRRLYALGPFLAGGVAAFATLPLGVHESHGGHVEVLVAAALSIGITGSALLPAERLPRALLSVPILATFAVVGLLRDAEGGAPSGYGPLVLLPVVWLALHASRRSVLASFAGVAAVFVVPIFAEPSSYPEAEWRRALLWIVVTPIVGLTTHNLVGRVRESSLVDPLTGLPNRRAWDAWLARAPAFAARTGLPFSVAMLDLDGFKDYNDTHGHLAGDERLVWAARQWRRRVRAVDLLARLGGDEFALLLPDATLDQARAVVTRAVEGARDIPCSVGVAEWDGRESVEALVRRADTDMYARKADRRWL
jgi:diguanylate cyclase (GGDEF)-like protein